MEAVQDEAISAGMDKLRLWLAERRLLNLESEITSVRPRSLVNHLYRMIVCSGRGHGPRGLEISSRRGCARNAATLYGAKAYRGDRVFFR
jgi:hypothetical protein